MLQNYHLEYIPAADCTGHIPFFFLLIPRPPISTLFPYTTLFRSNPIGLQRSFDGGKTLKKIAFEGESDFHVMAVGFSSHDIILLNEQKNSKLVEGIYLSEDSGESWMEVTASGLDGDILRSEERRVGKE